MYAKDIMNIEVVTVRHDDCARHVIRTLNDNRITGAPVLDDNDNLMGIVSLSDCLQETERGGSVSAQGLCFHRDLWWDLDDQERSVMVLDEALKASDLMTPEPFTVSEITPVAELVELMISKRIHRVVVTLQDRICGIVTTVDVMKACLNRLEPVA